MLNTERRIAALEASARDDNMKTEKKPENIKARRVRVFFLLEQALHLTKSPKFAYKAN